MTYSDGNFLIVSPDGENRYIGEYAADSSVFKHHGITADYPGLVTNQYFEYRIPVPEDVLESYRSAQEE